MKPGILPRDCPTLLAYVSLRRASAELLVPGLFKNLLIRALALMPLRSVEVFSEKTPIEYCQNLAFFLEFRWYANSSHF